MHCPRRRSSRVGKDAGVAKINSGLPAELRPECDGVTDRTGHRLVDEVRLVERVFAVGDVIVGAVVERAVGGDRTARIDVLVGAVEVRVQRRILDGQPVAEVVLDHGHPGLHVGIGIVVDRAAEECGEIAVRRKRRRRIETRPRADRRIAAIGKLLVVIKFVAELDLGIVVRLQRHGRIESVAFEMPVIAEGVAAFVESIQTHGDVVVHGLAGIERDAAVAVRAGLGRSLRRHASRPLP